MNSYVLCFLYGAIVGYLSTKKLGSLIFLVALLVLILVLINGCAYYNPELGLFMGYGNGKSNLNGKITEMSSNSPIKDMISINAVKGD